MFDVIPGDLVQENLRAFEDNTAELHSSILFLGWRSETKIFLD
jgi:hypothetical protein